MDRVYKSAFKSHVSRVLLKDNGIWGSWDLISTVSGGIWNWNIVVSVLNAFSYFISQV